jgi:hypothetical protein
MTFKLRNILWLLPTTGLWLLIFFVVLTTIWPGHTLSKFDLYAQEARLGEDLRVKLDYCKTRDRIPTAVRWSLQNEVTVVLPDTRFALPKGCYVRSVIIPMPRHIAPGKYRVQVEVEYRPWPWVTEVLVRQSAPIEVH